MANHLRICIVGGRSFGKTALVKAVAHIPCFVVRNYKGAADRLEKMPFDDPKWTQTKWEDVKDWQFKFTVEEDGKTKDKILSFADYAGEYFEEDYEDSPTGTEGKSPTGTEGNKVEETKVQKLLRNLWPWSGKKKAKRQINKLLYHPDGIIILLPRDFGSKKDGKDIYERSLYEKRVLEYLEKVRPGTPVQIVISKWDLNDEQEPQGASAVEIMSSPVFKTCYERILNGYRSCNGVEYNAGIIGISTKDLYDGEWIDETDIAKYKEAYNVRELFTKLSHAADVARTERLKTDWASAKWWKRWFVMPWRSLDIRRKNSDDKEVNGILARAWLRFLGFVAAAAIITCISIVAVVGLTERFRLDGIESDIAAASTRLDKVTKENLVEMDYQLGTNKWIHPIFFLPRLSELKGKLNELNTKYVAFLEEELDGKLKAPRVKVGSPWEVSSDVRLGVASNRLDIVKEQNKKLPVGMSSDAISQRLKTEEAVLVNLNRDVEFDKALYGLSKMGESQKLRGMDDIRIRFQYMKSYRTNDFLRLDSDIASLEKEQSTTLSNTLAQLEKEYPAGDLSVRRTLAQQKIDAINNALTNVFILGSVPHKEWSKQLEVVKSDKATDERYDPFDREYEPLGKNDLKAIAAFKEKHTVKEFPNRKDKLADLDRREAALIKQIMEGVKQNEKKFAYDDKDKSFKWRIGQAENLTNAYSVALGKLRKSDNEYIQIDTSLQSTVDWISGHEKYIEVENALASAKTEPETNKVRAIVKALKGYGKDLYPEFTNHLEKASKEAKRLSAEFVRDATNQNSIARTNQKGSWQSQVDAANARISDIKSVFSCVLEEDIPTLQAVINEECNLIADLKHGGEFDDAFAKVKQLPIETVISEIMFFRDRFKEADFNDRSDAYNELIAIETNALARIAQNFQIETNNIPDVAETNFLGLLERSRKLCAAYDHALDCIPSNHMAWAEYRYGLDNEGSNAHKYATWVRMNDEAMELMKTAKNLPQEEGEARLSGQQLMIMKVGGFLSRYPEKDNLDRELSEIYVGIKGVLSNAEDEVFKTYKEEGKAFEITAGMSDEEKFKAMKDRKALCEKYKNMFLVDSDEYHTIGLEIDELRRNLGDVEFEREFRAAYDDVKREINDDGKSVSVRIDKASRFISDYDKPDYIKKSFVAKAVEYVNEKMARLKIIDKFEQLKEKADSLVRSRRNWDDMPTDTDDGDSDKFHAHKKACSDLDNEIKPFRKYLFVANQVEQVLRMLDEEMKLMVNKVGNGSWEDIKKKGKKYKNEMSRANFEILMKAIESFYNNKDRDVAHNGKVSELKRNVETDRRLADDVKNMRMRFQDSPTHPNFTAFMNALKEFCDDQYRNNNDSFKTQCRNFRDQFCTSSGFYKPINCRWELLGFDFKNTDYERSTDYAIEVMFNGESQCYIHDIHADNWTPQKYYKGKNVNGFYSVDPSRTLEIEIKHKYSFLGSNLSRYSGCDIIAKGLKNKGNADIICELRKSGGNGKPKFAKVRFKFSGLPYLLEEEF